jgi:hypothetical protein
MLHITEWNKITSTGGVQLSFKVQIYNVSQLKYIEYSVYICVVYWHMKFIYVKCRDI